MFRSAARRSQVSLCSRNTTASVVRRFATPSRSVASAPTSSHLASPFNRQPQSAPLVCRPLIVPTRIPIRLYSRTANMEARSQAAAAEVDQLIKDNKVIIFGRTSCGYCVRAKKLFDQLKVPYKYLEVDTQDNGEYLHEALIAKTSRRTFPNIFVNGKNTGGCDDTMALHSKGQLAPMLKEAGLSPSL